MSANSVNPSGGAITSCEADKACEMIQCEVCLTEVPSSVAQSYEGPDYVHHFCGLDCFAKWRAKREAGGTAP